MYSSPAPTIVIHEAVQRSTTLPLALYVVGFAMQILGGVIVLLEVRDDLRAAKRLPAGGVTWETIQVAPEVIKTRLGTKRWRIVGVLLIFAGAAVGLAANLLALRA